MRSDTQDSYHRRIARVIETILADPGASHSVDSLAATANFSPFHFHRIYRALTGESIAATVRRVRMARAAHRLATTLDTVTNVAFDAGYDSPQAFARAFRDFTGVSPSQFQARQKDLAETTGDGRFADGDAPPRVELRELGSIDALCLRHHGPVATIRQTFRRLDRLAQDLGLNGEQADRIGVSWGDPDEDGGFTYLAGIVTTGPQPPCAPLEPVRLAGGYYGSHRLVGPHALIAPTFRSLFGGWLPQSGFEADNRPTLEIYCRRQPDAAPTQCVTDLFIPLRKE
jgi:AraC family transcriptional regulator